MTTQRYKIYTKFGDQGMTMLVGGAKVSKTHPRVAAYGALDSVQAELGVCYEAAKSAGLSKIVPTLYTLIERLFQLSAQVATPAHTPYPPYMTPLAESDVRWIEQEIDRFDTALPQLKNFIFPCGTLPSAFLHRTRTAVRAAERALLELHAYEAVPDAARIFVNRLSDLIFVLARTAVQEGGGNEIPWRSQPIAASRKKSK